MATTSAALLRTSTEDDLERQLREAKEELFNLRFQAATGQLESHGRLRTVRRDIARIYTVLRERELGIIGFVEPEVVTEDEAAVEPEADSEPEVEEAVAEEAAADETETPTAKKAATKKSAKKAATKKSAKKAATKKSTAKKSTARADDAATESTDDDPPAENGGDK
jgi:large subunit ribosomal protein L29